MSLSGKIKEASEKLKKEKEDSKPPITEEEKNVKNDISASNGTIAKESIIEPDKEDGQNTKDQKIISKKFILWGLWMIGIRN